MATNRWRFTGSFISTILITAAAIIIHVATTFNSSSSSYHSLFLSLADNFTAAAHLHALTALPHPSSTPADASAAVYVSRSLSNFKTRSTFYNVLLSFPIHRSLSLNGFEFSLIQKPYPSETPAAADVIPTFHAYAKSGTAVGPAVYCNYGTVEDFAALLEMGINVSGAVAVARYGKIYRGDIVRNAEDAGAVGVVTFTDKKDYGPKESFFPESKWMPPTGVQVGSTFTGVGDPTTPGWPSSDGCERISLVQVAEGGTVPGIPSLPVSAHDGEEILKAVSGKVAPDNWQGEDGAPVYHIGPGHGVLNINYTGNDTLATIQNVIAYIEGKEEPDRYVLLGNHRDAWTFGAADPNSGTAALLELAERLWTLQKRGWRPRRTIVLCNWDAEEYGLIGSTEWVEENRELLASRAVAYLNVDTAVCGPGFYAYATPQLDELLVQVSKQVADPNNSSRTVYESWIASADSPPIGRLGGGSTDFAAFIQHVGVPSVELAYGSAYPLYHSMYDDYVWMEKFGDPFFHRHVALASIWGLVALKLADEEFLPFNYLAYASELKKSTKILEDDVVERSLSFAPLHKSIEELQMAASIIEKQKKALESKIWTLEWRKDQLKVRELNDRLMIAERAFTDRGLLGKPWYKHLIYGPTSHNDYGSKAFPGINNAIDKAKSSNTWESWQLVQHEIWRAARVLAHASLVLRGQFT